MKHIILTLFAAILFIGCSNSEKKEEVKPQNTEWHAIAPEDIDGNIVQNMNDGMLLSAGVKDSMNTMAIGWGALGKLWKRPTLTVYVSGSRYTYEFMEKNEYFTVCRFDSTYHDKVIYMGSHTGRDTDKVKGSGLTLKFTEQGHPYYDEANLVIECRLLYKDELDVKQAPEDIAPMYNDAKPHTMYVGEIVNVLSKY